MTDSGVRKMLLAEKHYWKIRSHNPEIKLRHTKVKFRPYSTNVSVHLLGKLEVKLTNNNEKNPGWKAVHHKIRSLIPAEEGYSKVEGESLAVYSGVKMNKQNLYAMDHASLPSIYNFTSPALH